MLANIDRSAATCLALLTASHRGEYGPRTIWLSEVVLEPLQLVPENASPAVWRLRAAFSDRIALGQPGTAGSEFTPGRSVQD